MKQREDNNKLTRIMYFQIILCFLFIALHFGNLLFRPFLYHDVAGYLTMGDMILDGNRPYVEIIDINPPFAMYIAVIPAFIARIFHLDLALTGYLFYFFMEIFFLLLICRLVKKLKIVQSREELWLLGVFIVWGYSWIWYFHAFGQREHMIAMFLSVYTLYRYGRHNDYIFSSGQTFLYIFLAFSSFAMKLQYILPVFIVEIFFFIKYNNSRKRILSLISPDFTLFMVFGMMYLLHFLIIPGMSFFYTYWLGFVLKAYSSLNVSISDMLNYLFVYKRSLGIFAIIDLTLALWFAKYNKKALILAVSFSIFSIFSLIVYFQQCKLWPYQLVPFVMSFCISMFFLLKSVFKTLNNDYANIVKILIPIILFLSWFDIGNYFYNGKLRSILKFPTSNLTRAIKSITNKGDQVMFLHPRVETIYPTLTYANRQQACRYINCAPFPLIFQTSKDYVVPTKYIDDEEQAYSNLLEDLKNKKPPLIVISKLKNVPRVAPYFNMYDYLKKRGFLDKVAINYKEIASGSAFSLYIKKTSKIILK